MTLAKEIYQDEKPTNDGPFTISFDGDSGGYFPCWDDRNAAERVAKRFSIEWPTHTYVVISAV